MKKIDFKLIKNNKTIINKKNINCINTNNKLIFNIDKDKYIIENSYFIKDNKDYNIKLDLKKLLCIILLKSNNSILNTNIELEKYINNDNLIEIIYKIETEENTINHIKIEYK